MGEPTPPAIPRGLLETSRWRPPEPAFGAPVWRPRWQVERLANLLLRVLAPPLAATRAPAAPPAQLGPARRIAIPRRRRTDALDGRLFAASGAARGAVLLAPPWVAHGQAYLFLRRRIPALTAAGYHVLTFDFGGFGASGPPHPGFADRDVEDALDALRDLHPQLPPHYWGVSAGGYWGHLLLTRRAIAGAFFEQVFDHPIGWSRRMQPRASPAFHFFRRVLVGAYRYLHLNSHAGRREALVVGYVGAERDHGVPPKVTLRLAHLFDGKAHIVPDAGHLDAIRRDPEGIVELALDTFARAREHWRPDSEGGPVLAQPASRR